MRVKGETLDLIGALKAHVIVAMGRLRLAAGIDAIDLRGDLVARSEPGLRYHRNDVVSVVARERLRSAQRQLFQRVPYAVVGAGFGEMVAARLVLAALLVNDLKENPGDGVDAIEIVEAFAKHHNT